MKKFYIILLSLVIDFSASSQTTVQLGAAKDNTIYSDFTTNSNGAGPNFTAGKNASGGIRRALIKFDLSSIPSGSTVTAVTLTLHLNKTKPGADNVALHRASADWGEGTSNAGDPDGQGIAATTNDATWLRRFYNTISWTTNGGDYTASPSAVTSVAAVIGNYTWSSAGLISDVQAWVNNSATNFGWVIRSNETTNSTVNRFDSRQSATAAFQPVLSVTYSAPLPISLTSFKAENKPAGMLLSWQTASETDNKYFKIEHSTDGIRFNEIGKRNGAGTSAVPHAYTFIHNAQAGKNYYRLAFVSTQGNINYSQTLFADVKRSEITIFPDPASDILYISNSAEIRSYSIYNAGGAAIKKGSISGGAIDIRQLPSGIYRLSVINIDGSARVFSFSKL